MTKTAQLRLRLVDHTRLVARTCARCGQLWDADAYRWTPRSHDGKRIRSPWCLRCHSETSGAKTQQAQARSKAAEDEQNAALLHSAKRHRGRWTTADVDVLLREDLTAAEKAQRLGRSYHAVRSALARARREPKWLVLIAGEGRQ